MDTLHIAPNAGLAASTRAAHRSADGTSSDVLAFLDDLSCGGIDPSSAARRTWWATLPGDFGRRYLHEQDGTDLGGLWDRLDTAGNDARLVVWVGRLAAGELAFLHFFADRIGSRPFRVIAPGEADGPPAPRVALPPARIGPMLGTERPITDTEPRHLVERWLTLRAENAPLRVLTAAGLVSTPSTTSTPPCWTTPRPHRPLWGRSSPQPWPPSRFRCPITFCNNGSSHSSAPVPWRPTTTRPLRDRAGCHE
ncbi:DUF1835 domain-containing protein [Nocardia sp. CA-107356]|uniref:DUF1835 domain-containing protein n=1 Tax=Nocardia sp. CA-107356 TaxID=3239972 RepID=UPI003D8C87B0